MRVENKDDWMEISEDRACTYCDSRSVNLTRFYSSCLGHNVEWLCPYCCVAYGKGEDMITNSMAKMFNVLEKRLSKEE